MNVPKISLLAAFLAAGAAAPAFAADNANFQVLIDIDASCDVVSTGNVDFANRFATIKVTVTY